jgi:hypothetical protein
MPITNDHRKRCKRGITVKHKRRNGDIITAKITGSKAGPRGDFLSIRGDVGGKSLELWVRPSQVEII